MVVFLFEKFLYPSEGYQQHESPLGGSSKGGEPPQRRPLVKVEILHRLEGVEVSNRAGAKRAKGRKRKARKLGGMEGVRERGEGKMKGSERQEGQGQVNGGWVYTCNRGKGGYEGEHEKEGERREEKLEWHILHQEHLAWRNFFTESILYMRNSFGCFQPKPYLFISSSVLSFLTQRSPM